jgi:hypothetical protein
MMTGPCITAIRQRGVALVETVIILPLLLFLIVLTAEVTNAFVDHNSLAKATRNAARYLAANALLGTTGNVLLTPVVTTETRNLLVFGNTAGAGTPILSGLSIADVQVLDIGGNNVQVSATYAYTGLLGGSLPSFGIGPNSNLSMNLRATVAMRAL